MYQQFREKIESVSKASGDDNLFYYMRDNDEVEKTSYRQMYNIVSSMENEFAKAGFKRGDRVALLAPLSPGQVLTGLSLAYAGITTVLLDASLPKEEIEKLIIFSDVRAVFTTEGLYKSIKDTFKDSLDFFQLIQNDVIQPFGEENAIYNLKAPKTVDSDEDVIAIIYSSGTTGTMKGIKITYESIVKSANIFRRFVGTEPKSKYLYVFPFNHIAGYTLCYVFLFLRYEFGLIENMNASKMQKALLEFNPHIFAIIPKVFEVMEQKIRAKIRAKGKVVEVAIDALLSLCYFLRKNFGINLGWHLFKGIRNQAFGTNIRQIGGGGTMSNAANAKFFFGMGLEWSDVYASTETGVPIAATGIGDRIVAGTVGNINKHPEIQVTIGDKDQNGQGEILVKSELMMKGYFRQPELTKEAFDENGYFKTGDSGYIDKKGCLHVTGRIKESIVLQSGKKVSPSDVDSFYFEKMPAYEFASTGMPSEDKQYDRIHMFIKNENYDADEKEKIRSAFEEISRSAPSMYQLSGIHFTSKIEKTSIGKVKRFLLTIEDENADAECVVNEDNTVRELTDEERYFSIIRKYCTLENISMEYNLQDDLGIDSLNMYEIITELESAFRTDLSAASQGVDTVGELFEAIHNKEAKTTAENTLDLSCFPMKKSKKDVNKLNLTMKFMRMLWKFEVKGLENISSDGNYIICPNHESHFDGLFVFSALYEKNKVDLNKICCMAKKEHLNHRVTKNWLKMLGGIPVDRYGMSAPSIQRSVQCIKDGYTFLIHPEGTRTRNGELGEFKSGVAKIAEETGNKILPVRIDGAYDLYPYDKKLPKLFDWKHFRRCRLSITFGEPIEKGNCSAKELMSMVRNSIVEMGEVN